MLGGLCRRLSLCLRVAKRSADALRSVEYRLSEGHCCCALSAALQDGGISVFTICGLVKVAGLFGWR